MGKKKIVKLQIDQSKKDSFCVLGLASSYDDYKLIWELNTKGQFNFKICQEISIEKEHSSQSFIHYLHTEPLNERHIHFIKNTSSKGYFLESFSNFDYLLKIEETTTSHTKELKKQLDLLPGIRFTSIIPITGNKEIKKMELL